MKTFGKWQIQNLKELERRYREYLIDMANDKKFDIKTVEDFEAWCDDEYSMLCEEKDEEVM